MTPETTSQQPVIVWFRRDLRISDHPVLAEASALGRQVLPLFVVTPGLWEHSGPNRLRFLTDCLSQLDADLRHHLVIKVGRPEQVIADLVRQTGADLVLATYDVTEVSRRRDRRVRSSIEPLGAELRYADTPFVMAPGHLQTGSGKAYQVFTPFWREWWDAPHQPPLERPTRLNLHAGITSDPLPPLLPSSPHLPEGGEAAAHRRWQHFAGSTLDRYHVLRDDPSADGTSHLSADLRFGLIHPRELLAQLDPESEGHLAFARQLCWRDFYGQILWQRPDTLWKPWRPAFTHLRTDSGDLAAQRFEAWAQGRTGYPLVDAGMRQLISTGWMHNRVRMVSASFLIKDLHLPWQRGAAHFLHHLVDGDPANNNHGWQWVAGTGTDAAPFDRILNPITQSERFDPDGSYIGRWIPELSAVPTPAVHRPWTLPEGPPNGYPPPLVDHALERLETLHRISELRRR